MKPHRDLGVTQRTAWFMLHRIRKGLPCILLVTLDSVSRQGDPVSCQ